MVFEEREVFNECIGDKKRIRITTVGYPGSFHDITVWMSTPLHNHPNRFFTGKEYILGDSDYSPGVNLVPMFKRLPQSPLSRDEETFNDIASNARVRVEQAIGILKAKWASLRQLRHEIRTKKDIERACDWILACMILHNMFIEEDVDEGELHDALGEMREAESGRVAAMQCESQTSSSFSPGEKMRQAVVAQTLQEKIRRHSMQ